MIENAKQAEVSHFVRSDAFRAFPRTNMAATARTSRLYAVLRCLDAAVAKKLVASLERTFGALRMVGWLTEKPIS